MWPIVPTIAPSTVAVHGACPRADIGSEIARVQSEHGLGGFQSKLAHTLKQGRDRATEASDLCAANTKRTKARLKQVERAVTKYAHRLSSTAARRKIDDGLRAGSKRNMLMPCDGC